MTSSGRVGGCDIGGGYGDKNFVDSKEEEQHVFVVDGTNIDVVT